jgi:hypothetical protein
MSKHFLPWMATCRGCRKVLSCTVLRIPTGSRRKGVPAEFIVGAFIPYTSAGRESKRTILFSHGNAVDLGQMLPFYR